jgi:hypothetical protein
MSDIGRRASSPFNLTVPAAFVLIVWWLDA